MNVRFIWRSLYRIFLKSIKEHRFGFGSHITHNHRYPADSRVSFFFVCGNSIHDCK